MRGEEIKQKSLHEHFLSDSHQSFEEDVSICLIDKTEPLHHSYQIILSLKICKSECSIVTSLLHLYFLGLYVTYNVRGID